MSKVAKKKPVAKKSTDKDVYTIITSYIYSKHSTVDDAKKAIKKINLRKGEIAVIITPEGERMNVREAGK